MLSKEVVGADDVGATAFALFALLLRVPSPHRSKKKFLGKEKLCLPVSPTAKRERIVIVAVAYRPTDQPTANVAVS